MDVFCCTRLDRPSMPSAAMPARAAACRTGYTHSAVQAWQFDRDLACAPHHVINATLGGILHRAVVGAHLHLLRLSHQTDSHATAAALDAQAGCCFKQHIFHSCSLDTQAGCCSRNALTGLSIDIKTVIPTASSSLGVLEHNTKCCQTQ
eukprot:365725-Chlamydomonas_euryale.AAC.19